MDGPTKTCTITLPAALTEKQKATVLLYAGEANRGMNPCVLAAPQGLARSCAELLCPLADCVALPEMCSEMRHS